MTLELRNISLRTRGTLNPVSLQNITVRVGRHDRVAFLGGRAATGALLGVISGASAPDEGVVVRNSTLSWPIPGGGFLHRHQTFIANARFIARLYEVEQAPFIAKVIETARIGDLAEERLDRCPKDAVARFSFALGACLPFEIYLFTSTKVGDKRDSQRYAQMIMDLGRNAGLLLMASSGKAVQEFCDQAYVFDQGRAHHYRDMAAATEHMARIAKPLDAADDEPLAADDERVFDDF